MSQDNKSDSELGLDIMGAKHVAKAFDRTTEASIKAASAFLSRVFLPAAEELGLLVKDRVSLWRARNAAKIAQMAEHKCSQYEGELNPNARVVHETLEHGSWTEDPELQAMWAGLLATDCMNDNSDDRNVPFAAVLRQITSLQAKILDTACERSSVNLNIWGCMEPGPVSIELSTLVAKLECPDLFRLESEVEVLRGLNLLHHDEPSFQSWLSRQDDAPSYVDITPSILALHLVATVRGCAVSPTDYWINQSSGS